MQEGAELTREQIDQLADDIALCAARIASATHELLTQIRAFDAAGGWAVQGAKSCAHWLSWRIGLGIDAARQHVRVARRLAEFPRIDEAFRRGELSYTKVRAMVRDGMPVEKEALLLEQARAASGSQLEKICAGYRSVTADKLTDADRRYVRRRTHGDGTVSIEIRLLPDEAERIEQALRETQRQMASPSAGTRTPGDGSAEPPSLVDAAVAMAEAQLASPPVNSAPIERRQLFVHLREERIADTSEWKAELADGTALAGDTLKRLACDAGLVVAKTDNQDNPLDLGRKRRTVSAPLRRALMMRDRTCQFPGCGHRAFLDAHHLEHWLAGGETSADNLALFCSAHHTALHEGGFHAERDAGGTLHVYDPDGRRIDPHPAPPLLDATGSAPLATGVDIDPHAAIPNAIGPVSIRAAVNALLM